MASATDGASARPYKMTAVASFLTGLILAVAAYTLLLLALR